MTAFNKGVPRFGRQAAGIVRLRRLPKRLLGRFLWLFVAGSCLWSGSSACAVGFVDPLDAASVPDIRAVHEPLVAVAMAGSRIVLAGLRGTILYSDDKGTTWMQAAVPVQSDLAALDFLNPMDGWASGHDGVILHTHDGGRSWTKQFDGRGNVGFIDVYQKRVTAGDASAQAYVDVMKLNTHEGPSIPYLDVLFENANDGFAVGAYGMLIATHDGGAHWIPWLDHIDNPQFFYLNAIRSIGGNVYIVGEKGRVYKLDRARGYFVLSDTKYPGSLFGITGTGQTLLAYGMLGHAFRSADGGMSWQEVKTGSGSSISSGETLADGRVVLATQGSQLLVGNSDNTSFAPVTPNGGFPYAAVAATPHGLALVGLGGVAINPTP